MEENTERVRLGGYISVQQAGRGDGQLHPSDAVLRCDAASLALRGRAQSVGHDVRSQLMPLKTRSSGLNKYSFLTCYRKYQKREVLGGKTFIKNVIRRDIETTTGHFESTLDSKSCEKKG